MDFQELQRQVAALSVEVELAQAKAEAAVRAAGTVSKKHRELCLQVSLLKERLAPRAPNLGGFRGFGGVGGAQMVQEQQLLPFHMSGVDGMDRFGGQQASSSSKTSGGDLAELQREYQENQRLLTQLSVGQAAKGSSPSPTFSSPPSLLPMGTKFSPDSMQTFIPANSVSKHSPRAGSEVQEKPKPLGWVNALQSAGDKSWTPKVSSKQLPAWFQQCLDGRRKGVLMTKDLTKTWRNAQWKEALELCTGSQDPALQSFLGFCYSTGKIVGQDSKEASRRHRRAADKGDAAAQFTLGKGMARTSKDYMVAAKWYRLAAEQGHATAQFNLGNCLENGRGVPKDVEEAYRLYRMAAEQGHATAQFNLGNCLENGRGCSKDLKEAVQWHRQSADQGHAIAQFNLATCYYNGKGVEKDLKEALRWHRLAAQQGNFNSKKILRRLGEM